MTPRDITAVPDYGFNYDGIGNRTNYQKDQLKAQGTFNDLNQLTTLNYLGSLPYTGTVSASSGNLSTVSVDGTAESGVSGNPSVTLTGTVTTSNNNKIIVLAEDAQGRKSSTVKNVPNEFTSTYDANGNLKTEVGRAYYWNCENRLVRLDITDGEKITKLEFAYDFMGRRVSKKVYIKADAESSFVMDSSYAFGYSGFKLIVTFDVQNSSVLQAFVWQPGAVGLDIPLSVYDAGDDANLFYLSDANKNVVQVVDATGTIEAKYEYSPFGRITAQSGDYAESNPFRFSSEYHDNETGLVYYNFRYYSPVLGRWLSRDPIEEEGGGNLYGFVYNSAVNLFDILGLACSPEEMEALKRMILRDKGNLERIKNNTLKKYLKGGGFKNNSDFVTWFKDFNAKGGIGSAVITAGDLLWQNGKSTAHTSGSLISSSSRGSLLNTKTGRFVKGAGTAMSVVGAGFDTYDAYNSFKSGNTSQGIGSSTSAIGSTIGIFVPAIGIATAAGAGGVMIINWVNDANLDSGKKAKNKEMLKLYVKLYLSRLRKLNKIKQKLKNCEECE